MPTHFFTNQTDNSLLKKFNGLFTEMIGLEVFRAVVGYFRASGYFSIREHLQQLSEVKILVGINVDSIVADAQQRGLLFTNNPDRTRDEFVKWMQQDIREAKYTKEVEESIMLFMQDVIDGKIEVRAHNSKKLHAKFYIFLQKNFNENTSQRVIMGSSNLTEAGLGGERVRSNYEMNVEMNGYDDVKFAVDEFDKLWKDSTPILSTDAKKITDHTHLEHSFTPFEIYIKFLIEYFGKGINYDPSSIGDMPNAFRKLSYQVDAVNLGFEMLMQHNGFFLADVVGTGKTVVAAMLAKRFIIANRTSDTKILVVYPPALEKNWKRTFKLFGIERYCNFIRNGSLDKILDERSEDYWRKEEYDLVLVDEAHRFRNHTSQAYENLQLICKAGREVNGAITGTKKKVVLISATPLNNRPEDIYYLLQLFQDSRRSTLPIGNLQSFFGAKIEEYRRLKRQDPLDLEALRSLYGHIREEVIKPITIRRTRADLKANERYNKDLEEQGIRFPKVHEPFVKEYQMDGKLNELFYRTIGMVVDELRIGYYRYRAIEFLTQEANDNFYEDPILISNALAQIMRTQLVKRLESSFYAFKISLGRIATSTERMIKMFENDKVFIAPDLDINKLYDKGMSDEEIELLILEISDEKPGNRIFKASDFRPEMLAGLKSDLENLKILVEEWAKIDYDPKLDVFIAQMKNDLFNKQTNPSGKLIIFTESKDTSDYLTQQLTNNGFSKLLQVSSENRSRIFDIILENFDALFEREQKNDYDVVITTEVLAEGVNLHRANVIVNYDTPWNPTRLIQRLGRINRIGSTAGEIYNYNYYPSAEGDEQINLYKMSLMKLQGFHSAYGEDNRIYTLSEVVQQFALYEERPEERDIRLEYLEEVRRFKEENKAEFTRIQKLPTRARTARKPQNENYIKETTIGFLKNDWKKEIYFVASDGKAKPLTFEEAAPVFKAIATEQPVPLPEFHYVHINAAAKQFEKDSRMQANKGLLSDSNADARTRTAQKNLADLYAGGLMSLELEVAYEQIKPLLDEGTYVNLTKELFNLFRKTSDMKKIEQRVLQLATKYGSTVETEVEESEETRESHEPEIIISETFSA